MSDQIPSPGMGSEFASVHLVDEGPVPPETYLYSLAASNLLTGRELLLSGKLDSLTKVEDMYMERYMSELRRQLGDPQLGYGFSSQWASDQAIDRNRLIPPLPGENIEAAVDMAIRTTLPIDKEIKRLYQDEWQQPVSRQSAAYQVFLEVSEQQLSLMLAYEKDRILKLRDSGKASDN